MIAVGFALVVGILLAKGAADHVPLWADLLGSVVMLFAAITAGSAMWFEVKTDG